MLKLLTLIIFVLLTSDLFAQGNTKVYAGIENYRDNTPEYEDVIIEQRTDSDAAIIGNIDYDIYAADVIKGKKHLRNRSWAVERNDSMYINCHVIKYKWYIPALYRNDSFIYFRAFMSRLKEHEVQMHIAGKRAIDRSMRVSHGGTESDGLWLVGGAGAMATAEALKAAKLASERYDYLLYISTGEVKVLDIPMMQQLLEHNPELDRQYMNEGHPDDPESIIRYLKAAFE